MNPLVNGRRIGPSVTTYDEHSFPIIVIEELTASRNLAAPDEVLVRFYLTLELLNLGI